LDGLCCLSASGSAKAVTKSNSGGRGTRFTCRRRHIRYSVPGISTKAGLVKLRRLSTSAVFLAAVLSGAGAATLAQTTAPTPSTQATYTDQLSTTDASQPGSSESEAPLGPALPEQIKLTESLIPPNPPTDWASEHRLRFFGVDFSAGRTAATPGLPPDRGCSRSNRGRIDLVMSGYWTKQRSS
jgi:hypothetical protein